MFRLNADSAPLERELAGISSSAIKAGSDFGAKFGQNAFAQIKAFIGARAIANLVGGSWREGERIQKGAAKYGVYPEAFQIMEMGAEATGESLEEVRDVLEKASMSPGGLLRWEQLVADLELEGKVLSADQVKNMAAWEERIRRWNVNLKSAIGEISAIKPPEVIGAAAHATIMAGGPTPPTHKAAIDIMSEWLPKIWVAIEKQTKMQDEKL